MADVSSTFSALSSTESSNGPSGSANVGTGLDENLRMLGALLAAWRDQTAWGILTLTSVGGTANAITATLALSGSVSFGPTALAAGMKFLLVPGSNNSAATAITITSPNGGSSLGSKNIFWNGAACVGGELKSAIPCVIEYDGTQFNIIANGFAAPFSDANPVVVGSGDATKKVRIEADGITTATTRVWTARDADFTIGTATQAEQETGTSAVVPITPSVQRYHPSALKGAIKANFAGAIQASYNVTSITDDAAGLITVTWDTDFSSADYFVVATPLDNGAFKAARLVAQAAGSVQIAVTNQSFTNDDPTNILVLAAGDLV